MVWAKLWLSHIVAHIFILGQFTLLDKTQTKRWVWVMQLTPCESEVLGLTPHFIIMETEITDFNREMSQEERAYYGTHYDGER